MMNVLTLTQNGDQQKTNTVGKDMEKREPWYTVEQRYIDEACRKHFESLKKKI